MTDMPIKKFGAGAVQVAVWQNESKEGNVYNTISLNRLYKDGENWKNTSSLQVSDIPKAIAVLQRAYEFLAVKELKPITTK